MDGRIFGLDPQLVFDACLMAFNIFILFAAISYLVFNPVRDLLNKRKEKLESDKQIAIKNKEEAIRLKAEYDLKLKEINKEAEEILGASRKKALQNETLIVSEAKEEAARMINRANNEIELEKKKVKDEVKQEMITVASLIASKIVATSIDQNVQADLIEGTLKEMGDDTWLS